MRIRKWLRYYCCNIPIAATTPRVYQRLRWSLSQIWDKTSYKMVNVLNFNELMGGIQRNSRYQGKISLLAGNGFSIALDRCFRYDSLFEGFRQHVPAHLVRDFDRLVQQCGSEQPNSEDMQRKLGEAAKICAALGIEDPQGKFETLGDLFRECLIKALHTKHIARRNLTDENLKSCARFMQNFDRYFFLNYDLLPYWVAMWAKARARNFFDFQDGFYPKNTEIGDVLVWQETGWQNQNVFWLHGMLAFSMLHGDLTKWENVGANNPGDRLNLLDIIKLLFSYGGVPLCISSGTYEEKIENILKNEYLKNSINNFGRLDGCLFIHGFGFGSMDNHILELILGGNITRLAVSVMPGEENQRFVQMIALKRKQEDLNGKKLFFDLYDALSAKVWHQ